MRKADRSARLPEIPTGRLPRWQGFNLLVWVVPFVALGAGLVLVLLLVIEDRGPSAAGR